MKLRSMRILLCCALPFLMGFHPLYVSVTEIDYNPSAKSLEVAVRIFTDDLEKALEDQGTEKLYLGTASESEKADRYIATYLSQKFQIKSNGTEVSFNFLGKEAGLDVCWCYLEAVNIEKPDELEVQCKLLTEIYESQENIIHTRVGEMSKSIRLNRIKPAGTLSYLP